jgi:hypothetical protein
MRRKKQGAKCNAEEENTHRCAQIPHLQQKQLIREHLGLLNTKLGNEITDALLKQSDHCTTRAKLLVSRYIADKQILHPNKNKQQIIAGMAEDTRYFDADQRQKKITKETTDNNTGRDVPRTIVYLRSDYLQPKLRCTSCHKHINKD